MKRGVLLLSALIFIQPFLCFSQNPFPENGELFRDDIVPRIDIIIPQDSLTELFAQENLESYHHYLATFIFDTGDIRDTLENVGFRLRGNTSRSSAKKSFKISFNTYDPGRKYFGLEKLNLNGEHNDPSVVRSKVCWDLLRNMEVPAPRSNHIDLYVNESYFGVYINVEHIDEEFVRSRFGNNDGNLYKCLWPADLDYRGSDPDQYKFKSGDRRTYDLRTNTEEDDYSDLAHFIDVLNNTDSWSMPCELEKVLNVDNMLRAIAFDILSGNWDGPHYNKNNFYLYHNLKTGKFEYIPYDLDNTLGIDWLNRDWGTRDVYDWGKHGEPRPLFYNILSNPEMKNRLTYYLNEFIEKYFNEEVLFPYFDQIRTMITPGIIEDPFRPQDYNFSFQDFLNSYNQALSNFHVQYGLKPYVTTRVNSTIDQLQFGNIKPIIKNVELVREGDKILVSALVKDDEGIASVKCCYSHDGDTEKCIDLFDTGIGADDIYGDNIYAGYISLEILQGQLSYYVSGEDISDNNYRYPVCYELVYDMGLSDNYLFINELCSDNETVIQDNEGEYEDWLEIFNAGPDSVFLGDKYITDNPLESNKWKLPNIWIQAGGYTLFWMDNDEDQGGFHANFKLSKDGEFIGIYDNIGGSFVLLHGYDFPALDDDESYGCLPDASSNLSVLHPTPASSNQASGIFTEKESSKIIIYPNPNIGKFSILGVNIHKLQNIEIFNNAGKEIDFKYYIQGQKISIESNDFTEGHYFIKLDLSDHFLTKKLLINLK